MSNIHKASAPVTGPSLDGEWVFTFPSDSGSDKIAPAIFHEDAKTNTVNGTIAPVSGDFGLMSGTVSPGGTLPPSFSLSRFDGIHALLLEGQFDSADTLHGTLNKTSRFTAVRKRAGAQPKDALSAVPPDAESVTKLKNPEEVFRFKGVDALTGKTVTQDDFKGKPVIVDIFGTWCPNCHDEAPVLADLYRRYHASGLEIVGLAYEYTDDAQHNARLIDIYRKKYGIRFPLLVSGTTEEGQIAKTLPQLVGIWRVSDDDLHRPRRAGKEDSCWFRGSGDGKLEEVKKRFDHNVRA